MAQNAIPDMTKKMKPVLTRFLAACAPFSEEPGISALIRLRPLGGLEMNRVNPPTYASPTGENRDESRKKDAIYQRETRYGADGRRDAVVLHGIAACANRLESSIERLVAENMIRLPMITTVAGKENPKRISILAMPHRMADAFIRISTIKGKPVYETAPWKDFYGTNFEAAQDVVFRGNPVALLLGLWASTGMVRAERALRISKVYQSEIVGEVAGALQIPSGCIHPFQMSGDERAFVRYDRTKYETRMEKPDGEGWFEVPLADANLNTVPPTLVARGVSITANTFDMMSLSFGGLRKLTCPSWKTPDQRAAARAYLAALALVGHVAAAADYELRSGCNLAKAEEATYRWATNDPADTLPKIGVPEAVELYNLALAHLLAQNITFADGAKFDPDLRVEIDLPEDYQAKLDSYMYKDQAKSEKKKADKKANGGRK